ncbi:MAG TPA: BON domain-containing protein, partial [Pirellulales bacterium]|nr:BON domain-containing protein [Pirellulales bacterium]
TLAMDTSFSHLVSFPSDRDLQQRVAGALSRLQLPLFRSIRIVAAEGVIGLSGQVGSFYEKQIARAIARRVPGVHHVVDALTVVERAAPERLNARL